MRGPKTELTFQTYSDVSDGAGGVTRTWTDVGSIIGVLNALSGYERQGAMRKDVVYVSHRFVCDYESDSDISEFSRAKLGSRIFNIKFVHDVAEQGRQWIFDLQEVI